MNATTTAHDPKPCDITLAQLGGARRLGAMVGAKNFFSDNDGHTLSMTVMGGLTVKVTLDASDLYTVKVLRVRMNRKTFDCKVTELATASMVYADALIPTLEKATGLAWRL